jgi:plastocyanin
VWNGSFARKAFAACCAWAAVALAAGPLPGQEKAVTAKVRIKKQASTNSERPRGPASDASEVVVWLVPLDNLAAKNAPLEQPEKRLQVVQRNKSFQPHLTVVRAGSVVDFPNRDPFFHNVFSLFDGKRFDLGLYEAGATNSVRFDRAGVSFLFCNIHPEMSAVVVAVDTPFYSVSDKSGGVTIPNVPDGRYELHVWYERSQPDELKRLARTVRVSDDSRDMGTIIVPQNSEFSAAHKNKYGQDYPPAPKEGYPHP